MIILYTDSTEPARLLIGIDPEVMKQLEKDEPHFLVLQKECDALPPWTVSIGKNKSQFPQDREAQKRHIQYRIHDLDRFKNLGFIEVPLASLPLQPDTTPCPFDLTVFWVEDEDDFNEWLRADGKDHGYEIREFIDNRGRKVQ